MSVKVYWICQIRIFLLFYSDFLQETLDFKVRSRDPDHTQRVIRHATANACCVLGFIGHWKMFWGKNGKD